LQEAGEHFHCRRFAATVGTEKAEDLAALNAQADVVDGDETVETHGQAWASIAISRAPLLVHGGITMSLWPLRFSSGSSWMKAASNVSAPVRARSSDAVPLARILPHPSPPASRSAPPRPYRPWKQAHSCRMSCAQPINQFQNCARDSGSTPVVGSSSTSKSGSWISAQHRPSFLFHTSESLPAGRSRKVPDPCYRAVRNALMPLGLIVAEQAAEKIDVSHTDIVR